MTSPAEEDAMSGARAHLDLRLAKGEITVEEHKQLAAALARTSFTGVTSHGAPAPPPPPPPYQVVATPLSPAPPQIRSAGKGIPDWVWMGGAVGVAAIVGLGFIAANILKPSCKLENVAVVPASYFINGQLDAGFTATIRTTNLGGAANLEFVAVLSTSEGEFRRQRSIGFGEQQTRDVQFQFHEPTVNATNVQVSVQCGRVF